MKLSAIVRNARKSKGKTLWQVSKSIHVSQSVLSNIEGGRLLRPKIKTLNSLIKYFDLPRDETFLSAERIPEEVFYKLIRCPELLEVVRNHPES